MYFTVIISKQHHTGVISIETLKENLDAKGRTRVGGGGPGPECNEPLPRTSDRAGPFFLTVTVTATSDVYGPCLNPNMILEVDVLAMILD